jgi:hypothetical protein
MMHPEWAPGLRDSIVEGGASVTEMALEAY